MAKDFAAKPKPEPVVQSRVPRWVWLFTLVMTGAFVLMLVYLSKMSESESMPDFSEVKNSITQAIPEAVEIIPQVNTTDISSLAGQVEQTKEALSFYKLLTEQQVNVTPLTESESEKIDTTKYGWILQAASFRNLADAESLRAQTILAGIQDARVEAVNVPGKGTFHRVVIGPIDNRSKMNAFKDILVDLNVSPISRKVALSN